MAMQNTAYVSLSHQMALQRQMEMIAHNLANADSTSFKAHEPLFEEYRVDSGRRRDDVSFVQDYGVLINFSEGPIVETGSPLDVTLHGDGFFVVEAEGGQRLYSRNGHFGIDSDGQLVTTDGFVVLAADDQPIVVDPALGPVVFNVDGTVAVGDQPPVTLALVTFENLQQLRRAGAGAFATTQAELPAGDVRVLQNSLEGSNVLPILELTQLIETSRAYQASQRLVDTDHELQRKMAERIPQLRA